MGGLWRPNTCPNKLIPARSGAHRGDLAHQLCELLVLQARLARNALRGPPPRLLRCQVLVGSPQPRRQERVADPPPSVALHDRLIVGQGVDGLLHRLAAGETDLAGEGGSEDVLGSP